MSDGLPNNGNLPPGCADADIDDAFGEDDEERECAKCGEPLCPGTSLNVNWCCGCRGNTNCSACGECEDDNG